MTACSRNPALLRRRLRAAALACLALSLMLAAPAKAFAAGARPARQPARLDGPPGGYELRFSDEFDEPEIDETVWNFEEGPWPYNKELETYTRENAWIENGSLVIEAREEVRDNRTFTSARLTTMGKRDTLYGYWEVRAALPTGRGTWSAIWLLPTDLVYGGYLHSGEIDVAERVGYDAKRVHATVHTFENNSVNGRAFTAFTRLSRRDDSYHTYGLLWAEDRLTIYFDGAQVLHLLRPADYTSKNWPFDVPFHLILNLAVGGTWGGQKGIDRDAFPQRMLVDYVRYYALSDPAQKTS